MDPVIPSVDTSKPLSFDKLDSIEHLHDAKHTNETDHGMSKNYDVDDFLNLQKSPSNGLLDSYHESLTPENAPSDIILPEKHFQESNTSFSGDLINDSHSPINSQSHELLVGEPFCGTDKLNHLADYVVNDDVEQFIPSSVKTESKPSLLDFDPLNEPAFASDHDEFRSYTDASPITHTSPQFQDDVVEPVSKFHEFLPSESAVGLESATKSDKETGDKFKEIIDDSPRTGTPDFLELDSEDLKPIDVKPAETKPVDTKPIETKPVEVKPSEPKPAEKVPDKPTEVKKEKPKVEYFQDKPEIGPKEIFSKYGLVEAFIYWRDPKLSGIVFASGLVLLLSMAYYSLISVVANTGLTILVLAMGFRIYKHVLQAVHKTDQGHPYSVFLEWDLKLPQEKVHELVDTVLIHINAYVSELRRLFLIENWMESVRFAVVLWVLTYVGSWFNGLTLVIIAFVSLFTLPKVYENNKVQIDQNLALVHAKLEELTNKIKDVLPALLRKKLPEKKE